MSERPTCITIGPGRFSYAFVFKPKKNDDGTEKYSVTFLWSKKDKATTNKVKGAIEAAIEADASGKRKLKGKTKGLKLPLRDGDEAREGDGAYEGMYFFTANSNTAPGIADKNKEEILDPREFKSGDYGYINVNFYAFGEKGNLGIAVGLNFIMKSKTGPALTGGGGSIETAFEDIEIEESDDVEEFEEKPKVKKKKPKVKNYDEDGEGSEFF